MAHTAHTYVAEIFGVSDTQAQAWIDKSKQHFDKRGYVYAAHSASNGVKIGMTGGSPKRRVKAFNTCVKDPYVLISTIKTTDRRSMETLMHSFLQPQRVGEHNQELFDVEPEFVKKLFKTVKKLKRALSNEKTVVKLEAEVSVESGDALKIRHVMKKDGIRKFALVDYVMAITGRSRHDSATMICDSLKSVVNGEKAKKLLWDKHQFPGSGQREIYVVTIKEATSFLQCLPNKHTQDVLDYIDGQFFRVTVGDPSLHEEIDRNAKRKHVFACAMRESLDVDNRPLKVLKT